MDGLFTRESFQCNRYCGECCKRLIVNITKKDINKIKKLGYKENEFVDKDPIKKNKFLLKKNDEGCVFLKKHKDEKYSCSIHQNRPKICRQYPFFAKKAIESCLPEDMYPNVFFKFASSKKV